MGSKTSTIRILILVLASAMFFADGTFFSAKADPIALNEDNAEGTEGQLSWQIYEPGNYYLDTEEDPFSTTHRWAIRIWCSGVTLDGRGKTITGPGPATHAYSDSNVVGVYVSPGVYPQVTDITIKNFNVKNKYFGIWLEWMSEGKVENCITGNNTYGIYLWEVDFSTVTENTANNNSAVGIALEANVGAEDIPTVIQDNTLSNNTTNNNGQTGISLWLECINNTLTGNTANSNGDKGISLQNGSDNNTLTNNQASDNPIGIFIKNSINNQLNANTLDSNQNKGIWFLEADNNTVTGNTVSDTADKGIHLENGSDNNILTENTTKNNPIGIFIENSDNNDLSGNTISLNGSIGLWLWSADTNIIYNNYFTNSPTNVTLSGTNTNNIWNRSKTAGQNIVGGPFLGGNFWGNPGGTGFSQVTVDSDGDGICDSAYTLASGNVDALPLHTAMTELYVNQDQATCGGKTPCYTTIQQAINAASSGATIKIAHGTYNEHFELNNDKNISIEGGWDFSFATQTSTPTTIKAPLTTAGAITFLNLIKIAP